MWTTREIIIFLAGIEAFHTISHICIGYLCTLPIRCLSINWTKQLNLIAIIINAVITIALLWYANTL